MTVSFVRVQAVIYFIDQHITNFYIMPIKFSWSVDNFHSQLIVATGSGSVGVVISAARVGFNEWVES